LFSIFAFSLFRQGEIVPFDGGASNESKNGEKATVRKRPIFKNLPQVSRNQSI